MIITIKGANFSLANIGTLSTYIISKSIGSGAAFDIPNFVDKNSSVNWTITLDEGYTFGTYSVTMGGEVITPTVVDNVMTISIAEVTGNVRIVVATVYNGVEELPEPQMVTLTINPTPSTSTVVLAANGYVQNDNSITVSQGTTVSYIVSNDGYITSSDSVVINSNQTIDISLEKIPTSGDIDESQITWYFDNATQQNKTFNYGTHFPGAALVDDARVNSIRNVPINVIKFYPSDTSGNGGNFKMCKLTSGVKPSESDTYIINISSEDVYTTSPSNDAESRIYRLATPITLNENEYLVFNCEGGDSSDRNVGFWVNAGGQTGYNVGTYDNSNYTLKKEHWGLPFSIGYIE